ncbi:hypothetical protein D3C76_299970 [compost metagenome]
MQHFWGILSLLLFLLTGVFTVYSFTFPFEAGHILQGAWFGLIIFLSPLGLVMAIAGRRGSQSKLQMVAIGGNVALMLFLFLYMTFGVIVLGV